MFMAARTSLNPKSKINPEFSGKNHTTNRPAPQVAGQVQFPLSPSENDKLVWFLCPRNSDIWCQNHFHFQLIVDASMTPKNNLIIFYFDVLEKLEPQPKIVLVLVRGSLVQTVWCPEMAFEWPWTKCLFCCFWNIIIQLSC